MQHRLICLFLPVCVWVHLTMPMPHTHIRQRHVSHFCWQQMLHTAFVCVCVWLILCTCVWLCLCVFSQPWSLTQWWSLRQTNSLKLNNVITSVITADAASEQWLISCWSASFPPLCLPLRSVSGFRIWFTSPSAFLLSLQWITAFLSAALIQTDCRCLPLFSALLVVSSARSTICQETERQSEKKEQKEKRREGEREREREKERLGSWVEKGVCWFMSNILAVEQRRLSPGVIAFGGCFSHGTSHSH